MCSGAILFKSLLKVLWLAIACGLIALTISSFAATVTIDGAQQFQTIEGFGVNANHRSWNNNELQPVIDALIEQGGMTLFRVIYDKTDWEATNDNSDPSAINWSCYNQGVLRSGISEAVGPGILFEPKRDHGWPGL